MSFLLLIFNLPKYLAMVFRVLNLINSYSWGNSSLWVLLFVGFAFHASIYVSSLYHGGKQKQKRCCFLTCRIHSSKPSTIPWWTRFWRGNQLPIYIPTDCKIRLHRLDRGRVFSKRYFYLEFQICSEVYAVDHFINVVAILNSFVVKRILWDGQGQWWACCGCKFGSKNYYN